MTEQFWMGQTWADAWEIRGLNTRISNLVQRLKQERQLRAEWETYAGKQEKRAQYWECRAKEFEMLAKEAASQSERLNSAYTTMQQKASRAEAIAARQEETIPALKARLTAHTNRLQEERAQHEQAVQQMQTELEGELIRGLAQEVLVKALVAALPADHPLQNIDYQNQILSAAIADIEAYVHHLD